MNRIRTLLITTLAVIALSGCASVPSAIKGGADVGLAVASFGDCRAEWRRFVPADVREQVAGEVAVLDGHIASLNAVRQSNPDISFGAAAEKIVNGSNIKTEIEAGFQAIEQNAIDYAVSIGVDNQQLIDCSKTLRAAWKAVFESSGGVKLVEVLNALAPYAKYLPLLLENEGRGNGARLAFV